MYGSYGSSECPLAMKPIFSIVLVVSLIMLTVYGYPALAGRSFLPQRYDSMLFEKRDPRAWSRSQVLVAAGIGITAWSELASPVTSRSVALMLVGIALIVLGAILSIQLRRRPH